MHLLSDEIIIFKDDSQRAKRINITVFVFKTSVVPFVVKGLARSLTEYIFRIAQN